MTRRTGLDTDFPKPTFMLRVKNVVMSDYSIACVLIKNNSSTTNRSNLYRAESFFIFDRREPCEVDEDD